MVRPTPLLILLALILSAGAASAASFTVRQDDTGDFTTLQQALAAVAPGDELQIGPGTWSEGTLVLGFSVDLVSEDGAEATVLDGAGQRVIHATTSAVVNLTGLTISGGRADYGGGLLVDNAAVVTVSDCIVTGNDAREDGGGAYVTFVRSKLVFLNSELRSNTARDEGGAAASNIGARLEFEDCRIVGSRAALGTGGVSVFDRTILKVRRSVFIDNQGPNGGALAMNISSGFIQNNTFHDNASGRATVRLTTGLSVLFAGNIVSGDRSGFGLSSSQPITAGCNLYFGNEQGDTEGVPITEADVQQDPLFCDAEAGDLGLCSDSPALSLVDVCGVIGAGAVGCGPCGQVSTEITSWGSLKSLYR